MKKLIAKIQKILHDRRTRQFLTRFVSVTAAIVVFVTTYALVLPAITMEREAQCGIPAHQHDNSCYEEVLVCGLEESEDHQHTADCYEKKLVCGMEAHTHSIACYGDEVSANDKENAAVAAAHSLTGAVSETEGNDNSFDAYVGDFEGTDAAANESIQVTDDEADNYEENAAGASFDEMSTDALTDSPDKTDNGTSAGGTASDTISEEKDSEISVGETVSDTISEEKVSETFAEETASEVVSEAVSEANSAEIDQADTSRTEEVSGENINADPYVPALEPIDFNTVLTSSTGIYYYHKDPEADAETDADADDKTKPVTSAEITGWKPIEEDTILAPEDLIRVYLRYSVPAGQLNSTNTLARYRLPENIVLSEEQVAAINKAENGISAQYMDYDTLEVKDPAAHEEALGIEAIEGTRTPDQDVEEYLAGISGPEGDAREYISATVKVENIYAENIYANEGNYEKETVTYGNEDHADNVERESDSTWLGQDLIFTFTPYTVEKNRHEHDSSGQLTKAGQEVDGWLALDFNIDQVKWVETDRDVQTEEQVTDTEPDNDIESNEHNNDETADHTSENADAVTDADTNTITDTNTNADTNIGTNTDNVADHSDLGTNDETSSDKDAENLNSGKQDTLDLSKTVKTITTTTVRKEAEIVFVEEIKKDRDNNSESRDEISTNLTLVETSAEETEAHADGAAVDEETSALSKKQNADDSKKQGGDKEKEGKDKEKDQEEAEKEAEKEENKLSVAMPAATFEDSIVVRSGSLTSDTTATEPEETEITVHVEADKDTFPEGVKMVLKTVSEEDLEAVASAVEDAVSNDDTVSNKTRGFHALDISFVDKDGKEIEPLKPIRVSMSSEAIRAAVEDQTTAPVVVHVKDDNSDTDKEVVDPDKTENRETPENSENQNQDTFENREENKGTVTEATVIVTESAKQNPAEQNAAESEEKNSTDTITFTSDSFSVYAIVYTVDFHFEVNGRVFEFSIHGGETVSLKTVLSELNIVPGEEGEEKYSGLEQNSTNTDVDSGPGDSDTQETFEEPAEDNSGSPADGDDKTTAPLYEDAEEFISNIKSVTFTDEDLLRVTQITGNTTAAALKEALGLVVEPSAVITEEKLAEYDAREFAAPDWALISLKPFDSEEELAITMKNGDQFVIKVTDLNENPFGLNGKSFKIVNNSTAMTNNVTVTYGAGQVFGQNNTLSSGETWAFEYTGAGTKFLLKDGQGRFLVMIPSADPANGLVKGLQLTTNRTLAEMYPIVVQEVIDRNGTRGYALLDSTSTHALIHNNNSYYLAEENFAGNNTKPEYCMQLRNPSNPVKPGMVSTADTRSEGITINLFDYKSIVTKSYQNPNYPWNWISYEDDELDEANNAVPNAYNRGINQGHDLKFTSHGTAPSSSSNVSINNWADPSMNNSKYVSIQGVVQSELENGYPKLATGSKENLGYLFNTTAIENAKDVYADVNHLFIKDERGYYRYNSDQNYAFYNSTEGGGDFTVYAGTFNEEGGDGHLNEAIGFFPFNDYDAGHTCIHGDGNDFYYYNGHNSSQTPGWYNHQFGMTLEANFVMTPDGKYLGDDIVFNFSGDDDLWVFVDGVLVLDIGGIHNPVAGSINFNSGKVTVRDDVNGGTPSQMVVKGGVAGPGSIEEAFERVTGKEWDDSPYTRHKLQVFYMERGGMYSNLSINFNLPVYKTVTVEKKLEGLTETQQQRYNDEYFYYQVNVNGEPYSGPYGVLTRPATKQETADWEPKYETINGEQVYIGGKWKANTNHSDTETINKNGELVKWHISVEEGLVRVKPGWYFTIEELGQDATFSVKELYGYDSRFDNKFHDEQEDASQTTNLMDPFLTPLADYRYKTDPLNPLKEEELPLYKVTAYDHDAWSSSNSDHPEKPVQYSDWVLFYNNLATALNVQKVWYDSNGNVVTDTSDSAKYKPISYKIYRIPYQLIDNPEYDPNYVPADPDNPDHPEKMSPKKRVDYPVQEVKHGDEHSSTSSIGYVSTMEGFTGTLSYNSNDAEKSWKETVSNLPTVGWYLHEGQTDRKRVLYEYYISEISNVDGYKHSIEGGLITNDGNEGESNEETDDDLNNDTQGESNNDSQEDHEGEYQYIIKNEPVSPVDKFTELNIEKDWLDAEGNHESDVDLHKDDYIQFDVTQKQYKAMAAIGEGDNKANKKLYPITINLWDEGGTPASQGGKREVDTVVVYVPEGADFVIEPLYNTSNESTHVVSVGGSGIAVDPDSDTRTEHYDYNSPSPDAPAPPSNTYYYSGARFKLDNVDSAKEVTLWLHAGHDEWVYLYDDYDPDDSPYERINYLKKDEKPGDHPVPHYHAWTCQLYCSDKVIWDLDEVYYHIVEKKDAYILEDENAPVSTKHKYDMRLFKEEDSEEYTTHIDPLHNAPGNGHGDSEQLWKGSITDLPLYEFANTDDGGTYIYTYEIVEKTIGSEEVTVSPVYGTEDSPLLYNGQTSQYLVKWEEQTDGTLKFTNKKKETTEVSAFKKWVDPDLNDMTPPEGAAVTFELFADGVSTGKEVVLIGKKVQDQIDEINASTEMTDEEKAAAIAHLRSLTYGELTTAWKAEWKDLPKYNYAEITVIPEATPAETPNVPIVYTVKETVEYSGYQNMNPDGVDGVNDNGVITNKQLKYNLKIVKVDADDRTIGLSGAKFQMTRKLPGESTFTKFDHDSFEVEDNNKRTGPFTVSSPQGITLEGLVPGEYRIEEKVAPDGYNIILQPFTFTLVTDGTVTTSDSDNSLVVLFQKSGDDPSGLQIGNTPGSALPHTGGPGTKLFIFLGIMLTVFAGAGLIIRKTN